MRRWFVPAVLLLILLIAAACGAALLGPMLRLRLSQPYRLALQQVQQDAAVVARLGEPIQPTGWFPVGRLHVENGRGEATLDFDVAGPDAQAHVRAQGRRAAGEWGLARLTVTFDDGRQVTLGTLRADGSEAGSEAGGGMAPLWSPQP